MHFPKKSCRLSENLPSCDFYPQTHRRKHESHKAPHPTSTDCHTTVPLADQPKSSFKQPNPRGETPTIYPTQPISSIPNLCEPTNLRECISTLPATKHDDDYLGDPSKASNTNFFPVTTTSYRSSQGPKLRLRVPVYSIRLRFALYTQQRIFEGRYVVRICSLTTSRKFHSPFTRIFPR